MERRASGPGEEEEEEEEKEGSTETGAGIVATQARGWVQKSAVEVGGPWGRGQERTLSPRVLGQGAWVSAGEGRALSSAGGRQLSDWPHTSSLHGNPFPLYKAELGLHTHITP